MCVTEKSVPLFVMRLYRQLEHGLHLWCGKPCASYRHDVITRLKHGLFLKYRKSYSSYLKDAVTKTGS